MRIFEHYPPKSDCFLCGENTDKPCVLIEVDGTGDGWIAQAEPVHVDCIISKLRVNREMGLIYGRRNGTTSV